MKWAVVQRFDPERDPSLANDLGRILDLADEARTQPATTDTYGAFCAALAARADHGEEGRVLFEAMVAEPLRGLFDVRRADDGAGGGLYYGETTRTVAGREVPCYVVQAGGDLEVVQALTRALGYQSSTMRAPHAIVCDGPGSYWGIELAGGALPERCPNCNALPMCEPFACRHAWHAAAREEQLQRPRVARAREADRATATALLLAGGHAPVDAPAVEPMPLGGICQCGWSLPVAPVPICVELVDRPDFFVRVGLEDLSAEAVAELMPEDCGALMLCPKCAAPHAFFVDEIGAYDVENDRDVVVHDGGPEAPRAMQDPRDVDAAAVASALRGKSQEELAALLSVVPTDALARLLVARLSP